MTSGREWAVLDYDGEACHRCGDAGLPPCPGGCVGGSVRRGVSGVLALLGGVRVGQNNRMMGGFWSTPPAVWVFPEGTDQ